jgi:uncharacterized protein (TIGR02611 family)
MRDRLYTVYRDRRESIRVHQSLDLAWRAIIFIVGGTLVGLGAFFLIFPGPGWATIFIGFLVLGTEFRWARSVVVPLEKAAARLSDHTQRHAHGLMAAQMAVIFIGVTLSYAYVSIWGFEMQGVFVLREQIQSWIAGSR